jgi:hypothetical protein
VRMFVSVLLLSTLGSCLAKLPKPPEPPPPVVDPVPDPPPVDPPADPPPPPVDPVPDPDPAPNPPPSPGAAPLLVRVDAYTLSNLARNDTRVPTPDKANPVGVRGGRMILDSTPKFRVWDGARSIVTACNADRATQCGCPEGQPTCREDKRGHVWARLDGNCPWRYNDPEGENPTSGFSIKVGPFDGSCQSTFIAYPRSDFPGPREGATQGRGVKVVVR